MLQFGDDGFCYARIDLLKFTHVICRCLAVLFWRMACRLLLLFRTGTVVIEAAKYDKACGQIFFIPSGAEKNLKQPEGSEGISPKELQQRNVGWRQFIRHEMPGEP